MKPNDNDRKRVERALLAGMTAGTVAVPHLLLRYYHRMKLSELEVMLLIHILAFQENEKKDFPTHDEIQDRMTTPQDQVIEAIQKLVNSGVLRIEQEIDSVSDIQYERYNLRPMYEKSRAAMRRISFKKRPDRRRPRGPKPSLDGKRTSIRSSKRNLPGR